MVDWVQSLTKAMEPRLGRRCHRRSRERVSRLRGAQSAWPPDWSSSILGSEHKCVDSWAHLDCAPCT